jgi:hypothetical protein
MRNLFRPYRRLSIVLTLAFAFVGVAGVASAQQTCIEIIDNIPETPTFLYRLTVTQPGNNTVTVVGTATAAGRPGARIVTGGGALIGGQFELSLTGTDIIDAPLPPDERLLVQHTTHIVFTGPSFTSGLFETVQVRTFEAVNGFGTRTNLNEGTATIVSCPPLS